MRRGAITSIGRWSSSHPWRAIGAWLLFVVACVALGVTFGTKELNNGAVGESARGYDMLDRNEVWPYAREVALLQSKTLVTSDAPFRSAVGDVVRRVSSLPGINTETTISRDRHSALVVMTLTDYVPIEQIRSTVEAAAVAHPQLRIEETGEISASEAQHNAVDRDLQRAELLSVPVTFAVLLFAFGSLVAAIVPVVLAITAVVAAFGLLGPLSQAFPVQDSVKTVVLLIGMAVGVDYALFYVTRSREERRRGAPAHEALETTERTSGRTVLVSGTTVVIAMAGMFVVGAAILNGIAAGAIAVIACAVVGSLTVLPAILELLGTRIDRGRIPFLPHLRTDTSASRFWTTVLERVLRRPVLACALSIGIVSLLAVPTLWLHVSKPSGEALASQSEPALAALGRVRRAFPGSGSPARVVVEVPPGERAAARKEVERLRTLAIQRGITHEPVEITANASQTAAGITMPLNGDGSDSSSRRSIALLRHELIPATLGRIRGARTAVTGDTAEDVDFTHQLAWAAPYVIVFVLALAFVLLLLAFRSIVVPLKAIVLNLLSVGASYGVLVAVFQWGWAEQVLGFHSDGAIVAWLPMFLFVILFGLSMDYHVFILSRVRELVDRGEGTDAAVRHGITMTAGVVTSAALVMVGVFSLFGTLSSLDIKQAGVGLAVAVLLDATVIRAVLLPASMKLLGEWNWYLPPFLRRLPETPAEAH